MNVTPDDRGLRWPFPVFRSLDGYRWTWLPRDVTAGILVVAIAIPLSMGMAEVAGMPPIAGLYSCVLPLIAYALFGSSRQLVIALDASTAAMVARGCADRGRDPIRYAALAGLVAVLVGLVLMLAGSASGDRREPAVETRAPRVPGGARHGRDHQPATSAARGHGSSR